MITTDNKWLITLLRMFADQGQRMYDAIAQQEEQIKSLLKYSQELQTKYTTARNDIEAHQMSIAMLEKQRDELLAKEHPPKGVPSCMKEKPKTMKRIPRKVQSSD